MKIVLRDRRRIDAIACARLIAGGLAILWVNRYFLHLPSVRMLGALCPIFIFTLSNMIAAHRKAIIFNKDGVSEMNGKKTIWQISWSEVKAVSAKTAPTFRPGNYIGIDSNKNIIEKAIQFKEWRLSRRESEQQGQVLNATGIPLFEQVFSAFGHHLTPLSASIQQYQNDNTAHQ